jgi:hypothetical protein
MKKIIAFLSVLLISVISGVTFGSILNVNPVIPGIVSFVVSYIPIPLAAGSLFDLVFTSPAAAATYSFPLTYIPQFLIYDAAAAPLTNLIVSEQNDGVILDLPLAGIAEVKHYMRFGLVTSTVTRFRLANGYIKNKNVTVKLIQPGAVAIPFYTCSDCPGNTAFKYGTVALTAGTPVYFTDFTALFLPGLAANDTVLVKFANGHSQLFNRAELLELTSLYQNNQLATGFILNNINSYIKSAIVTEAIAGSAYVMKINIKRNGQ